MPNSANLGLRIAEIKRLSLQRERIPPPCQFGWLPAALRTDLQCIEHAERVSFGLEVRRDEGTAEIAWERRP